jgi:tRNA/tmRNA/rRNA uracil-C5-methylase (TrmA/RlmC/RlmD family)
VIDGPRVKRLFGNRHLSIKVNEIIYTYAPEGFSQVNLSICPDMLNNAKRLLEHDDKGRLLDLYCGYGFFACFLSGDYEEIVVLIMVKLLLILQEKI